MKNFITKFLLVIGFVLFNQLSVSAQKILPPPGVTTYTVYSGQNKTETDNVSVTLKPGVHIQLGAEFHAYITGVPPETTPNAPTNLVATATSASQINLAWTDNASNETGFQVWSSQNAGSGFTLIHTTGVNVTSYANSGLSPSTTRYYKVRAINSSSQSDYSNEAHATTSSVSGGDCVDWNKPSTIKWIGINNIQDNTSGGTKDHPWSLRYGMEGGGAATLHDGDVVYIKGDEGDYIIGSNSEGIEISIEATGTNIEQNLANGNIQEIMSKCVHFMTAPSHDRAVIKKIGYGNSAYRKDVINIGKQIVDDQNPIVGSGVLLWNLEVTSSGWQRNRQSGVGSALGGVKVFAPSSGVINSVIHNNSTNMSSNKHAKGFLFYGNLISQSGYIKDMDNNNVKENHGPNIYFQYEENNQKARIQHNIAQFSGTENFNAYSESEPLASSMNWLDNVAFDASAVINRDELETYNRGDRNFFLGGHHIKTDNNFIGNLSYTGDSNNSSRDQLGYYPLGIDTVLQPCIAPGSDSTEYEYPHKGLAANVTTNMIVEDNYLHSSGGLTIMLYGKNNVFKNNTIIGKSNQILDFTIYKGDESSISNQNFDTNNYYNNNPESRAFYYHGYNPNGTNCGQNDNKTFSKWKSDVGRDLNSTIGTLPTSNKFFYRTNLLREYGTSGLQGYIVIYNWENKNTVTIDPSQSDMLCSGDEYKIVDSQNFKNSLVSGVYSGGDISINMNQATVTPTTGAVPGLGTPNHTDKKFICLMVYKTDVDYKGAAAKTSGNSSINVYPNPTAGVITINFESSNLTVGAIRIVDKLNQNIKYSVLQKDKTKMTIRIHGGNEEIYFMKINTANGVLTEKIVIKK